MMKIFGYCTAIIFCNTKTDTELITHRAQLTLPRIPDGGGEVADRLGPRTTCEPPFQQTAGVGGRTDADCA